MEAGRVLEDDCDDDPQQMCPIIRHINSCASCCVPLIKSSIPNTFLMENSSGMIGDKDDNDEEKEKSPLPTNGAAERRRSRGCRSCFNISIKSCPMIDDDDDNDNDDDGGDVR